ncbi:ABC transporter G family [Klebsormidium nitens]|uniref:ABC transporter G family n=1 Tax=Klebsormidium nitens TaxID=105231 RepID=A0A1Y1I2G9_KLENI|nr:ABC transporter G family [Klebsormidium nitens]|eukprot:GAQ82936.1 ABC transporter G family [Klebsormidium nitens]
MDPENGIHAAHTANGAHEAHAALEMQAPHGDAAAHDLEKGHSRKLKDATLSLSAQTVRVSLEWRQLNYSIVVKKGKGKAEEGKVTKRILKNLSGTVRAGTFVAIMGPTGSGKTSLLNALAGRLQRVGTLDGEILVNGKPRENTFKRITAYVMQDDVLYSSLTVQETLTTAALLRLPSKMSPQKKMERVDSIVSELGLGKARNTIIGNAFRRGVSGGERKRANIAVEMLSNPSMIFLDEPTSGLDSFQALNVMSSLGALADKGRTIISTIHQPRSSIYALFEDLLLLSEGEMIYFGPASQAVAYFDSKGLTCPQHFNPADFFMDKISLDSRDPEREKESTGRVKMLQAEWQKNLPEVTPAGADVTKGDLSKGLEDSSLGKYASSWILQFRVLLWRAFIQTSRDRLPLMIALVQSIVMSCIVGALFSTVGNDQKALQNRTGVIFFTTIFVAFNGVFQMITTFPVERAVIARERAANAYRVSAFYPAKVIAEWPLRVIATIIFVTVVYWIVGFQHDAGKFFRYLLIGIWEFTAMNGVGLLVSAIAPTPPVALALGPLVTVICMLFGGFYINLNSIPVALRWISNLSPIKWAFIGFSINELEGRSFSGCANVTESTCYSTGDKYLRYLSIEDYTVWESIGYQTIVMIGAHFLAYITLRYNRVRYQPLTAIKKKQ